jgi:phospholipase/carboxylesterase
MNAATEGDDSTKPAAILQYLVRQPNIQTGKPPLIILLHGVGSSEQAMFSFAGELPGNFLVVSARAPYQLSAGRYAWYQVDFSTGKPMINTDQEEKSRNNIVQFIQELKQQLSFDDEQVYLGGFSQGAIMAYSLGLTRPDLIHGIAVLSGRLLEEVKPMIVLDKNLQELKVFIAHGINDGTLNIQYAHAGVAYLKTLGIKLTYKEYLEGHGINKEMLLDLSKWLRIT